MEKTRVMGGFVIHFIEIERPNHKAHGLNAVEIAYKNALRRAKKLGGKKYHNKSYGGGIKFPHHITEEDIKNV